jgi:hypothetical protein
VVNCSGSSSEGRIVISVALFVGVFCAVGFAYACTEYAMTTLDVRQRVTTGDAGLKLILSVHGLSLVLTWVSALILVAASGQRLYLQASVIALGAQAIWLTYYLSSYSRDHLRVRREVPRFESRPKGDFLAASHPQFDSRQRDEFLATSRPQFVSSRRDEFLAASRAQFDTSRKDEFLAASRAQFDTSRRDEFLAASRAQFDTSRRDDFAAASRSLFLALDELYRDAAKPTEIGVQGVALSGEHDAGK